MSEAQRGSFTVALASSSIVDVLVIPGLPSLSVEMTLMDCMGQDTPLLALKLGMRAELSSKIRSAQVLEFS